ncbi:hypothetical protein [Nitrosomonas sp. Nm33]|uniref:hypothetical protein n=1 Tax=Nitrosomonas sp. Nm33 TaxID=133724 RepID=UPI00089B6684|nr:hypothetical protein [Nitrosomonas sp. Nm33]SDZ05842.1 hypothetical protein SAMN05421755_10967 [Nitrosomonas sp. Nm33]
MAMTNAERQKKFREKNIGVKGKNFRLQSIIDLKTHAELERLVLRLNQSKQDVIARAIHELAEKLGCEIDEWEKEQYQ